MTPDGKLRGPYLPREKNLSKPVIAEVLKLEGADYEVSSDRLLRRLYEISDEIHPDLSQKLKLKPEEAEALLDKIGEIAADDDSRLGKSFRRRGINHVLIQRVKDTLLG